MKNKVTGFSLIELMIVIAIIGILAAIAIPAYGDYIVRSKASEMLIGAGSLKTAISEYRMVQGSFPLTVSSIGTDPAGNSNIISSVALAREGTSRSQITIVGDATALGTSSDVTLYLEGTYSNGGVTWLCTTDTSSANVKYLPASCRNARVTGVTWATS